ncbi:choice-of-anchor Q domain-containing protein [Niabella hirudinis]|uniref:choice-of-anchor Q domain-containing protein n=1 Tax=Niabella hirudinis TaxID=1285929 RepID=UPI003EBCD9D5
MNITIHKKVYALFICFTLVFAANSAATVRYVRTTGTGAGTSWSTASNDLQKMINASGAGDEIWVAAGIYLPTRKADDITGSSTPNDRNNSFLLKADVKIYGGFLGNETSLSQRNWLTNTTILSGDFSGNDIVSGRGSSLSITNNGENACHVVIAADAVGTATIDGFTVKGGNANSQTTIYVNSRLIRQNTGGGMHNTASSPTIANCSFTGNNADWVGGLYNHFSYSTIINCSFTQNYTVSVGGGGMHNEGFSTTITNCSFTGNYTDDSGGGMYNSSGAAPTITNCSFSGNYATLLGGGIFDDETNFSVQLRNSIIWGNTAANGAGIFEYGPNAIVNNSIVQGGVNGNKNPLFVDAANGNVRLQCGSPAINAGNNSYIPGGITTDLDGNARIQGTTVDMGAYEGGAVSTSTALATAAASDTKIQASIGITYYGSCGSLIATVQRSGSSPISGSTTAKVWVDASQPAQYVKRHYQITPDNNASTVTGKVTLYFTQQDFTDFNNQTPAPALLLPTGPSDATGISNLRIEKRPGISSDGSGAPNTYTGTPTTLQPLDNNITWNPILNRWEIDFGVNGFSGFFVKTSASPLPVSFGEINAVIKNSALIVSWQTLTETNNDRFEIEASQDGVNFTTIATVASKAQNGNSSTTIQYSWEADSGALAAFSGLSIILLILLLPVAQRYKKQLLMASVVLLIAFISCSKRTDSLAENPGDKYFIRIAQVDKDGGKTYSKMVRVVN